MTDYIRRLESHHLHLFIMDRGEVIKALVDCFKTTKTCVTLAAQTASKINNSNGAESLAAVTLQETKASKAVALLHLAKALPFEPFYMAEAVFILTWGVASIKNEVPQLIELARNNLSHTDVQNVHSSP